MFRFVEHYCHAYCVEKAINQHGSCLRYRKVPSCAFGEHISGQGLRSRGYKCQTEILGLDGVTNVLSEVFYPERKKR